MTQLKINTNYSEENKMPKFNKRSKRILSSCHDELQILFNEVINRYDCTILEGHRSNEEQERLYCQGKSKLKAGKSKHNIYPSHAVDVARYPINWNDKVSFYHFAGYVKATADLMDIKIRCGVDWDSDNNLHDQTFFDLPHFELVNVPKVIGKCKI